MTVEERAYVLGTHDAEIERLGLQHRVWRARALEGWSRAGFNVGQRIIDVGCGPGYATADLAELVGPSGEIVSIDRSERFLDVVRQTASARRLPVRTLSIDFAHSGVPPLAADGAWVRWVFAFVPRPQELLQSIHAALRPGGKLVVHEYYDYRTWRLSPRDEHFEQFVSAVMKSWRDDGGEPDVGFDLPRWMREAGFDVQWRQFSDMIRPDDHLWQWPRAFIETGLQHMVDQGRITEAHAELVRAAFARVTADPHGHMVIPSVVELIGTKINA
jgi:SAM-dependent methyltransferase